MKRNLICISCPIGCSLTAEIENGEVVSVTGNTCKRGDLYARTECVHPERSLTSTVKVNGGIRPIVSVKSSKPIPKETMFDCMTLINKAEVTAPVKIGDVVIENILDTGANIVATNDLPVNE